jgi:asparagine synthase (glutamine-hydrolysing)
MCGLFGCNTVDQPIDLDCARKALASLTHRGPDQWGEWSGDRLYMGHRRLSILDLSERGRQPMVSSDGRVVISVNGEIYNFARLRAELERKHEFCSDSDSEVVLHGYVEWGIDGLLERIDGMYAFAIYDQAAGKVFVARDRVGIKPLYYALIEGQFIWASELKAIREYVGADRLKQDVTALYDFLTYLYVPTPKTLYQDVFKLPPAHYAVFDCQQRSLKVNRYWQLAVQERVMNRQEAATELRRLVDQSVSEQLMSDVPVGVFLSGGLDSSIVAESANRFSRHIQTFTIRVDDPGHDESADAQCLADHIGTDHHVQTCGAADANEWMENVQGWYDEPFGDMSAIPTHLVSRFSRERIVVALSGDGGDELFGGYRWYTAMQSRAARRWHGQHWLRPLTAIMKRCTGKTLPGRAIRRFEFDWVLDDLEYYTRLMGGLMKDDKRHYARAWGIDPDYDDYWHFRKYWRPDLPLMTRLQYLDFHTYLPDDILTKVDRASMQVALEVRVPLLSKELIEFAFSLPEEVRYAGGRLKGLLKEAYGEILPERILHKPKQGFGLPMKEWNIMDGRRSTLQERVLLHYQNHVIEPDALSS